MLLAWVFREGGAGPIRNGCSGADSSVSPGTRNWSPAGGGPSRPRLRRLGSLSRLLIQPPPVRRHRHPRRPGNCPNRAGGLRTGPGSREHERHRSRLSANGSVRAAAGAHGAMGRVPGRVVLDLVPAFPDRRFRVSPGTGAAAGRPAKAGGPAYPLCTQWDWRGDATPPFEPPASRAAAGATDGRGLRPRTPAPARARRRGAPLWSPPTSPRQSRSPWTKPRRPSGSKTPGSALTSPSAPQYDVTLISVARRIPRSTMAWVKSCAAWHRTQSGVGPP